MNIWLEGKPELRARLYLIAQAALVVAAAYGYVNGDKSDLWLTLVAAVLNVSRKNIQY